MQRLKGVKGNDHYSALLAALGSERSGAGSVAAQLATVARGTTLGLSMTEVRTQSLAQAGCLEKGHGQHRVPALGWAPRVSLGVTGEPGWGERLGCEVGALQHRDPRPPTRRLRPASPCGEGCDGGRYSPPRDALELKNSILNQCRLLEDIQSPCATSD